MKKGSSVVIALLAVLAIVFGILFITKNNETSDLNNRIKSLEETLAGRKTDEEVQTAIDEAVEAAKTEAVEGLKNADEVQAAIDEAVGAAKEEAQKALDEAVAAAKTEATAGLKTAEEVEAAIADAVAAAKAEAVKGLKNADEVQAAIDEAVGAAKKEAQKAIDDAEARAEELSKRVTELEAQIGTAAAGTEAGNDEEPAKEEEAPAENTVEAAPEAGENAQENTEVPEEPKEEPKEEMEAPAEAAVMTYAEYMAAEMDSEVVVEMYVQAHQSWWENTVNVYGQDQDGGYYAYNLACSEEDAAKLVPGTKIRVKGTKTQWPEAVGEIEITEGTFEFVEGADSFIAEPADVTDKLGTDELTGLMNVFASFKGMTVTASKDADGNDAAFLYKWNGTGADGDDLYFNVSVNGAEYTFVVESYLCPAGSEVYEAVKALQIGDVIDLEGFLYWYEGVQPHITKVTKAE